MKKEPSWRFCHLQPIPKSVLQEQSSSLQCNIAQKTLWISKKQLWKYIVTSDVFWQLFYWALQTYLGALGSRPQCLVVVGLYLFQHYHIYLSRWNLPLFHQYIWLNLPTNKLNLESPKLNIWATTTQTQQLRLSGWGNNWLITFCGLGTEREIYTTVSLIGFISVVFHFTAGKYT